MVGLCKGRYTINATAFKVLAIVLMFVDHFAAIVLDTFLRARNQVDLSIYTNVEAEAFVEMSYAIYYVNYIMRCIGRLAFPMFCFLLVEGMYHTRKPLGYLGRLAIFALISEIPFNVGFRGTLLDTDYQNVLFTLLVGATVIMGIQRIRQGHSLHSFVKGVAIIGLVLLGGALTEFGNTDYGMYGVLTIVAIYFLRGKPILQGVAAGSVLFVMSSIQMYSYLVIPLFQRYNGEKGRQSKYFFYFFYPLHILCLYGISQLVIKLL